MNEFKVDAPPSTIREVIPYSEYNLFNSRPKEMFPVCIELSISMQSRENTVAFSGMRGERNVTGRGLPPGQSLVVREGLSIIMVLLPTKMASYRARWECISTDVAAFDNLMLRGVPSWLMAAMNPSLL